MIVLTIPIPYVGEDISGSPLLRRTDEDGTDNRHPILDRELLQNGDPHQILHSIEPMRIAMQTNMEAPESAQDAITPSC